LAMSFMLIIILILTLNPVYLKSQEMKTLLFSDPLFTFEKGPARGIHLFIKDGDYQKAIEFIRDNVEEDEKIFVGTTRHDMLVINDILFYFLSGRHSATKYHELHPGHATTIEIQHRIIDEIEILGVDHIVLVDFDFRGLNEKIKDSDVHILDNFIKDNFVIDVRYGNYSIWRRTTHISM